MRRPSTWGERSKKATDIEDASTEGWRQPLFTGTQRRQTGRKATPPARKPSGKIKDKARSGDWTGMTCK